MPSLTELYLNGNKITSISNFGSMPALKKLVLDGNKIENIDKLPKLPSLEVLDLSNNKIATDSCLPLFAKFPKLHTLIMTGCPYAEEKGDSFKNEVLVILGTELNFKMVNEDEVTEDDLTAAKEDREARALAKKEAEEEAARAEAERLEAERAAAEKPEEDA